MTVFVNFFDVSAILFGIVFFSTSVSTASFTSQESQSENFDKARHQIRAYCHSEFDDPSSSEYQACSEGIRLLEDVLRVRGEDSELLSVLLAGYLNRSRERGLEIARKLSKIDPQNAKALAYLALWADNDDEQIALLQRLAEASPTDNFVHVNLARALLRNGSTDEAIDAFRRQLSVNPNIQSAILAFVDELLRVGTAQEISVVLQAYVRSARRRRSKCRLFDNHVYADFLGDSDLRTVFQEECNGFANYTLATLENDPFKKTELLKSAIGAEPRHPAAHGELAWALMEGAGDIDTATNHMLRQIDIDPVAPVERILEFAQRAAASGRRDKAVEVYTALLGSRAPITLKCEMLDNLAADTFTEFSDFLGLLESTCPEPNPG